MTLVSAPRGQLESPRTPIRTPRERRGPSAISVSHSANRPYVQTAIDLRTNARPLLLVSLITLAAASTGCPPSPGVREDANRITEIQKLKDENQRLKTELAQKNDQLATQSSTIASLRGLEGERSLDKVIHAEKVEIDRLSGGYDDNRDGIDDGVVVYLSLFDQFGGSMRATGSASITVLDLSNPRDPQVVGEVKLSSDELGKLWYGSFLTAHYTIKLPWPGGRTQPPAKDLTVVATFTDLLTGKTMTSQRVVQLTGHAQSTTQPANP